MSSVNVFIMSQRLATRTKTHAGGAFKSPVDANEDDDLLDVFRSRQNVHIIPTVV